MSHVCSHCDTPLPPGRVYSLCRDCGTSYAAERTAKRRRVSLVELVAAPVTTTQRTAILSRIAHSTQTRWHAHGTYETLMMQVSQRQRFTCAVTRANLASDAMSLVRVDANVVFVLPIVSVLLDSFALAPAAHVIAAVIETGGSSCYAAADAVRARVGCRCSLEVDSVERPNAVSVFAETLTTRLGRFSHGFMAKSVQQTAPPGLLRPPYRCAPSNGVLLSSLKNDPSSCIYFSGAIISALHWRTSPLKECEIQLAALRRWLRLRQVVDGDGDAAASESGVAHCYHSASPHTQTFRDFVREATRWCV